MLTLFSPSKINLFFKLVDKRADGFHSIFSLFQSISLGDELQLALATKTLLSCTDPNVPLDNSNLVLRALAVFNEELQKRGRESLAVQMHLIKRVPIQSGLGGGSGNAATALWGFNELATRPLSEAELCALAGQIGSDAAFFFSRGSALCSGKGELIQELPTDLLGTVTIAKPCFGLSTPDVYKASQLELLPNCNLKELEQEALQGRYEPFNDLETAAFQLRPELLQIKRQLLALGFKRVVMTGSGSALVCFGHVDKPKLSGITFYPTHFISRTKRYWYHS